MVVHSILPPLAPHSYIPYIHRTMNRPIHSKTFKSGNSVAMRLPKALGIPAGADVELLRNGNRVTIQLSVDPAQAKRRWLAALDALDRLPKPGAIEQREPIEFPDRPGL